MSKARQAKQNEMLDSLRQVMQGFLEAHRLDQVLNTLSLVCLDRVKKMMAENITEDSQGHTLRVLFEFNERIAALGRSAGRKNGQAEEERITGAKEDFKVKRAKVDRKWSGEDDEIE